jgi:hypothetical protein
MRAKTEENMRLQDNINIKCTDPKSDIIEDTMRYLNENDKSKSVNTVEELYKVVESYMFGSSKSQEQ